MHDTRNVRYYMSFKHMFMGFFREKCFIFQLTHTSTSLSSIVDTVSSSAATAAQRNENKMSEIFFNYQLFPDFSWWFSASSCSCCSQICVLLHCCKSAKKLWVFRAILPLPPPWANFMSGLLARISLQIFLHPREVVLQQQTHRTMKCLRRKIQK